MTHPNRFAGTDTRWTQLDDLAMYDSGRVHGDGVPTWLLEVIVAMLILAVAIAWWRGAGGDPWRWYGNVLHWWF